MVGDQAKSPRLDKAWAALQDDMAIVTEPHVTPPEERRDWDALTPEQRRVFNAHPPGVRTFSYLEEARQESCSRFVAPTCSDRQAAESAQRR